MDNAIQAVMGVDDPQKRVISVKVIAQNQLSVIQIQNYYEGELKFENDLPVTTKKNQIFNLQILLPTPKIM